MKFRDLQVGDVFEYVNATEQRFKKIAPQKVAKPGGKCSRCGGSVVNAIDLATSEKLKFPQSLQVRKIEE
jgi:hypothetical protein